MSTFKNLHYLDQGVFFLPLTSLALGNGLLRLQTGLRAGLFRLRAGLEVAEAVDNLGFDLF